MRTLADLQTISWLPTPPGLCCTTREGNAGTCAQTKPSGSSQHCAAANNSAGNPLLPSHAANFHLCDLGAPEDPGALQPWGGFGCWLCGCLKVRPQAANLFHCSNAKRLQVWRLSTSATFRDVPHCKAIKNILGPALIFRIASKNKRIILQSHRIRKHT